MHYWTALGYSFGSFATGTVWTLGVNWNSFGWEARELIRIGQKSISFMFKGRIGNLKDLIANRVFIAFIEGTPTSLE